MIQDKGLRCIIAIAMCIALAFPLINVYGIFPAFSSFVIRNTEEEAVRLARHLSAATVRRGAVLDATTMADEFVTAVVTAQEDFNLVKVKVFAASGEVLYSTDRSDVGKVNEKPYFHNVVAKGAPYTKVIKKDTETLDGGPSAVDVVETYVPISRDGEFLGVFELYYDITERLAELRNILAYATAVPAGLMFVFFTATMFAAVRADRNIRERDATRGKLVRSQCEIQEKHRELEFVFGQVEKAKKVWERTMDCIGDLIMVSDEQGTIRRCNWAVVDLIGVSYDDVLGMGLDELLERNFDVGRTLDDGLELCHTKSNQWFLMRTRDFTLEEGGTSEGSVTTLHNTTELRILAEKLERQSVSIRRHRNKLKQALEQITDLIEKVAVEKSFSIRFKNPDLVKCWEENNCTHEECPCHGKGVTRCWQIVGTFCGGAVHGAYAQKIGNCSQCEVFRKATRDPVYSIGEQFNNMMYILEEKNAELDEAYRELKATQSRILQQEKMASIGQLAAGVAHEINNPVGFVSSNLRTLAKYAGKLEEFIAVQEELVKTLDGAEVAEAFAAARKRLKVDYILNDLQDLVNESLEGTRRVEKIVSDLKGFSRVDQAEYKEADLNECIESTLNIVHNEIKYKATVTKDLGTLPMVKCYPQQLNQVFMNLFINAAHAIEKHGEIGIVSRVREGFIEVAVSDTGCGIPEENRARLFEPFFTTKEVGKGTGLGLSIANDIVKKHGGEIVVESTVGQGTTFTVRIPVETPEEHDIEPPPAKAAGV